MSRLIRGPEDVSVGDIVSFPVGNKHRDGYMEGTVASVLADRLVVDVHGKKRSVKMWKERRANCFTQAKYRDHRIYKLTAEDLWLREKPPGWDLRPSSIIHKIEEATISTSALVAMSPEDASSRLHAFIEWLKRRPE